MSHKTGIKQQKSTDKFEKLVLIGFLNNCWWSRLAELWTAVNKLVKTFQCFQKLMNIRKISETNMSVIFYYVSFTISILFVHVNKTYRSPLKCIK